MSFPASPLLLFARSIFVLVVEVVVDVVVEVVVVVVVVEVVVVVVEVVVVVVIVVVVVDVVVIPGTKQHPSYSCSSGTLHTQKKLDTPQKMTK